MATVVISREKYLTNSDVAHTQTTLSQTDTPLTKSVISAAQLTNSVTIRPLANPPVTLFVKKPLANKNKPC